MKKKIETLKPSTSAIIREDPIMIYPCNPLVSESDQNQECHKDSLCTTAWKEI